VILWPDGDAVVAIGQASHAWLSGQLARAWGNDHFPAPSPWEEVCLGAEQHDVGMALWDLLPERHPETGRPLQFFELDRRTHLALWTEAPLRLLTQSRYAALLVSLHGTGLYERFPPRTDDPEVAQAIADYLGGQRALQERLAAEVGATHEELLRNQALLAAWDGISLALCRRQAAAFEARGVPGREGPVTITLAAEGDHHTLYPWPLNVATLEVRAEGRRLDGPPAPDQPALHAALERAPVQTVRFTLRPRRP
jgi:Protein of unknown function (DUF3891)